MPFTRPAYPPILTKADWDRQKGKIAKLAGKTGVGEAMQKCERAYAAVDWDKLELSKGAPGINSFVKSEWDKKLADAKSEAQGDLRKFVESMYALRDVAKKAAEAFGKNKLIPSSSKQHAEQIAKTADFLGVSMNTNSIGKPIMDDYNALLARVQQIADGMPGILQSVLARTPGVIAELRRKSEMTPLPVADLGDGLKKAARDITQNITNIVLFIEKRGIDVAGIEVRELPQLKQISNTLVGWGNNDHIFRADATKQTVQAELQQFERTCQQLVAVMR